MGGPSLMRKRMLNIIAHCIGMYGDPVCENTKAIGRIGSAWLKRQHKLQPALFPFTSSQGKGSGETPALLSKTAEGQLMNGRAGH
ncbi:hypothetical protein HHI36_021620 [Cryptolaemus montrouzieri]|uniref:Uncharacterized protein n=1 Tax=Cryptolaemus montrouzieri TaxID=559131 RepID=A0ABD2MX99_9CUCU